MLGPCQTFSRPQAALEELCQPRFCAVLLVPSVAKPCHVVRNESALHSGSPFNLLDNLTPAL
eukprot:1122278-Alexandrium_andersonii.AAC.1